MSLAVLPELRIGFGPKGTIILTQKFIDGMVEYLKYWDGSAVAIMEPTDKPSWNLDEVEVDPARLPFQVEAVSYDDPGLGELLAGHTVVLASLSHLQSHISRLCRSIGVPCVYVSEYTFKTRCQIVRIETNSPLLRWRRIWWQYNQELRCAGRSGWQRASSAMERRHSRLIVSAIPGRCFSSIRVSRELADHGTRIRRTDQPVDVGRPAAALVLGATGPMKGVDHLVRVASKLRSLHVPFELTICGDGPLEPQIRADITRLRLDDCVKLTGVIDFKTELTPLTKHQADLFVCCHRQGDPSCTYVDVMSCGVAFVGYDNEAFQGIVRHSAAGWMVPMDRTDRLAEKIAELSANPPRS